MKVAQAKDWKLPRHLRIAIADQLADMARDAEPTPFAIEGPARHGIRASLCLQGWPWQASDAEATILTFRSLEILNAKRPTWQQGQPEWTQEAVLPILRERCIQCGKKLPDKNRKFCSDVCGSAYRLKSAKRQKGFEEEIARTSGKAIRTAECPQCKKTFMQKQRSQRFCSRKCVDKSLRFRGRQMPSVPRPL